MNAAAAASEPAELAAAAARVLAERTGVARHDVAVVLGSGWVPAVDALGGPAAELASPTSPASPRRPWRGTPAAALARRSGRRVLAFLGRTHLYEGRGVGPVVHGVRVAAAAGCRVVVLTNACGGVRPGLAVGDPVLIADHLNLTARTPLVGARFVDLTDVYSARLREMVRVADPSIAEGVYAQFPGPQYETPAEVRMAAVLGADLVGMSTVLEAIAAHAEGCEVLGISLVTNLAAGIAEPLDHEEVLAVGKASAARMGGLLATVIARL